MKVFSSLPGWAWSAAAGATLVLLIGALAIATGLPALFPSLGPTIYLQVVQPRLPAARPWNVAAGHAIGALAAIGAVLVLGAGDAPAVLATGAPSWPRVTAATLAIGLALPVQILLRASHPPAAATALIVALGALSITPGDLGALAVGLVAVTLMGEAARYLRLASAD